MSPLNPTRKDPSGQDTKHPSKGALLITPLSLSRVSDPNCPVCHEAYCELPALHQPLLLDQEFAVSIDMVAEWHGSKKLCGHVLGRKCFERHLRSKGAWRNRCPLCRDVWFHGDEAIDEEDTDEEVQEDEPSEPDATTIPPRRSARVAAQTIPGPNISSPRLSVSSGVNRARYGQQQSSGPRHFTRKLLAALEVRADGDEVAGTMEDVERRLKTLYRDMYE